MTTSCRYSIDPYSAHFRALCEIVEDAAFAQGICINLDLLSACYYDHGIIHRDDITGDAYVLLDELQEVVNMFADDIDVDCY